MDGESAFRFGGIVFQIYNEKWSTGAPGTDNKSLQVEDDLNRNTYCPCFTRRPATAREERERPQTRSNVVRIL
jgi:hypothetical protein